MKKYWLLGEISGFMYITYFLSYFTAVHISVKANVEDIQRGRKEENINYYITRMGLSSQFTNYMNILSI